MAKYLVTSDDVETQVHPWGRVQWMSEPKVTDTDNMATAFVTIEPGQGHLRHNHEGSEQIIYFLGGEALQTIEVPECKLGKKMSAGDLAFIPSDVFHSTMNIGEGPLTFLSVYQHAGPEAALRADPQCKITPPKNK